METEQQLLLFIFLVVGGIVFEGIFSNLYHRNTKKSYKKHFSLGRYLFLLLFPILGSIVTFIVAGETPLKVFLLFAFLGPILEWSIGFSYQSIVGQKLWTYHRYSITGNTSLLAIPFWGFAGVLFYYLARVF